MQEPGSLPFLSKAELFFCTALEEELPVAAGLPNARSPLPKEEGVQHTQRRLSAELFAQQAPACLVANAKKQKC